jgi:DNA-binding transcriptional ArsR family regulator
MQPLLFIDRIDRASILLHPLRLQLLKRMVEPSTCTRLAESLGEAPQKVYYHVKKLEEAGLVEKVSERRVRGTVESSYRAAARSYWLSPELVGRIGGRRASQDRTSLAYLRSLAEQLHGDVGRLSQETGDEVDSLGVSAQIELKDQEQRTAFARDVQDMIQQLAEKYGRTAGSPPAGSRTETYRLMLACYPRREYETQLEGEPNDG